MQHSIHIGTSGWVYGDWQGRFYPEDVKGSDRLSYYAEQFDTVEVNATFYRLPTQNMIDAWNRRLPAGAELVYMEYCRGNSCIRKELLGLM